MNLGGLGFLSLPKAPLINKQKTDLMPLNPYKYWEINKVIGNNQALTNIEFLNTYVLTWTLMYWLEFYKADLNSTTDSNPYKSEEINTLFIFLILFMTLMVKHKYITITGC